MFRQVCSAGIWNQGKAAALTSFSSSEFAPPEFGIKAKQAIDEEEKSMQFAPPEFGIKAKQRAWFLAEAVEFAPPEFGIKAKRQSDCQELQR